MIALHTLKVAAILKTQYTTDYPVLGRPACCTRFTVQMCAGCPYNNGGFVGLDSSPFQLHPYNNLTTVVRLRSLFFFWMFRQTTNCRLVLQRSWTISPPSYKYFSWLISGPKPTRVGARRARQASPLLRDQYFTLSRSCLCSTERRKNVTLVLQVNVLGSNLSEDMDPPSLIWTTLQIMFSIFSLS